MSETKVLCKNKDMVKDDSNKIVSIVIVTCGVGNYIKACIDSIKVQTYPGLEITVINNSLNSSFAEDFEQYCSSGKLSIKLYSSPKNLFYCDALNKGITMSRGNFILCLNDDVVLDKRFIKIVLRGFRVDKRIGMVSGKILRPDGKIIDSTGLFLNPCRTSEEFGAPIEKIEKDCMGLIQELLKRKIVVDKGNN